MNEALRLAHWLERDGATCQQHIDAATELRRLYDLHGKANALCRIRAERIKELEAELIEQARVNGMGSEREARLMAVNAELVEALSFIAEHDLRGTDLVVAGHMAHGFIGRARAALAKAEASNGS